MSSPKCQKCKKEEAKTFAEDKEVCFSCAAVLWREADENLADDYWENLFDFGD